MTKLIGKYPHDAASRSTLPKTIPSLMLSASKNHQFYRLDVLDTALDALDLDLLPLLLRRVRRSEELSEPIVSLAYFPTFTSLKNSLLV